MARKQKNKFSKTPVIILELGGSKSIFRGIYEKAMEFEFRVLDLKITQGTIPPNLNIIGHITSGINDKPIIKSILDKKLPVIRVGSYPYPERDKIIPAIVPDAVTSGKLAADHFADRNFKSVGFVCNYPWAEDPILYNAFRERALERGCECHLLKIKSPLLDKSSKRYESRKDQILNCLKDLPKPTGIFTYNDLSAARVYTIASNAGYEIPEEFAILGYANTQEICEFLPVQLSSIDINREEQGRFAVELLYSLINGGTKPTEPIIIPPKGVVIRQSTNLLAVPDPVVAKALRFIWDHFTEQISINDVAFVAGVARSTITRKFRECINHGVNSELRRKRLELAKKLLIASRMTINDIAIESGFPSPTYFHIAFKESFAMTPGDFRKKTKNKNTG